MKKKSFVLFSAVLIFAFQVFAGVVKKTKAEVDFAKFGKFTSVQMAKISGLKKVTDSESRFKGRGIMGRLAGKFALKSGKTGEIIDLPEMIIYKLNHKKKEYRVSPIEKIFEEGEIEEPVSEEEYEEEPEESNIRIVRSEFKVEDTGESKTINQFPCRKYNIHWLVEWEDIKTGEKGTNRLSTIVWTTPLNGSIKKLREEEMNFTREHMKRVGLDLDTIQQEILGTKWLSIFTQMSSEGESPGQDVSQFAEEIKKLKGYPVVIDGKFYSTKQGGQEAEEEEESGDVKKMFGRFAKKALKKKSKKSDATKPAFSYYIELMEFRPADIGPDAFQVPANYKKKG